LFNLRTDLANRKRSRVDFWHRLDVERVTAAQQESQLPTIQLWYNGALVATENVTEIAREGIEIA
jgi:hypothetical protein